MTTAPTDPGIGLDCWETSGIRDTEVDGNLLETQFVLVLGEVVAVGSQLAKARLWFVVVRLDKSAENVSAEEHQPIAAGFPHFQMDFSRFWRTLSP